MIGSRVFVLVLLLLGGCVGQISEVPSGGSSEALRGEHEGKAKRHRAKKAKSAFVAVGDSNIAGFGATDDYGAAQQLADDFEETEKKDKFAELNIAVPGSTSQELIDAQLDEAIDFIDSKRLKKVDEDLTVLIGTGGNDLRRFMISPEYAELCGANPQNPACMGRLAQILLQARANLDYIFSTLAAEADEGTLMAQTQPNVFLAPHCYPSGVAPVAHVALEGDPAFPAPGLNQSIRELAAAHGFDVIEAAGAIAQNELPLLQGAPGETMVAADCTHPNDAGHAMIKALYDAALND